MRFNQIALCLCPTEWGAFKKVVEYDFSSSVKAKSALETLMARCTQVHAEIVLSDTYFSADLIRACSVTPEFFGEHWTRTEWLQSGWITACWARYRMAVDLIKAGHADLSYANQMPELRSGHYDLLHATFSTLSNGQLSASSKIQEVIARYKSRPIADLLVEGIRFEDEQLLNEEASQALRSAREVAFELWDLLELDTELSDWERRQISWESLTKETLSVDLDTQNFPIEQDKDASNYWIWKRPNILTDRGQLLSASDLPLDVFDFADGMAGWQIDDLNGIETEETIAQLLNEAVALHEWTIPPNAFVEVSSDHLLVRR